MSESFAKKQRNLAELCVSAFIRLCCKMDEIPAELIQLCFIMYFELHDTWDESMVDDNIQIDDEDNILVKGDDYEWGNALGSLAVKQGECKIWKFKVLTEDIDVRIGIADPREIRRNCQYSFYLENNTEYEYNVYNKDDVICMKLDMTGDKSFGNLSYKVNDGGWDVQGLDDVDSDIEYRMAVTIYDPGKLQLLQ